MREAFKLNKGNIIVRKRIIDLLNEATNYKVMFVTARMGRGKTTEIYNWATYTNIKVRFCNLNDEDDEQTICNKINNIYNFQYASIKELINGLPNIAVKKESILVFDSFETLTDKIETQKLIARLIENMPELVHLIILSRGTLPKEYKQFLLTGNLKIITQNDLKFTEEEIKEYLIQNNCKLDDKQIEEIVTAVDGSPIQLNSIIHNLSQNGFEYNAEVLRKSYQDVIEYFDYGFFNTLTEQYQHFLIKLSRLKELTPDIVTEIAHGRDGTEILEKLYLRTSILEKNGEEYALSPFFKMYFISKKLKNNEEEELISIYNKLAYKYEQSNENLKAIEYYAKTENYSKVAELIDKQTYYYHMGEIYHMNLGKYLETVPEQYKMQSSAMCYVMLIEAILKYDTKEIKKWYELIKSRAENTPIDSCRYVARKKIWLIAEWLLPANTPADLLRLFCRMDNIDENLSVAVREELTFADNQPTILSGRKDFSDWSLQEELIDNLLSNNSFKKCFASDSIEGVREILLGEIAYQKNDLSTALNYLGEGMLKCEKNKNIELIYVGMIINIKILFANNEIKSYQYFLKKLKQQIIETKAEHLMDNLEAEEVRFALMEGSIKLAEKWLNNKAPHIINFNILERYRYLIKVRAYIATKQYSHALIILKKLQPYFQETERIYNLLEDYILQAICFDKMSDEKSSLEYIEKAILLAQKYKFIRAFADEGLTCNRILVKYNKTCVNEHINKAFLKDIIAQTRQVGDFYPELYANEELRELTKNEIKVLELINNGLKNVEIVEVLGVSMATVKTHVNHIFSKLKVENRIQAINMAKKHGII